MTYNMNINWNVEFTVNAEKQAIKLSEGVLLRLRLLFKNLQTNGPTMHRWPNYGKFKNTKGDRRHCHLQKGKPTYVCCWEVLDKKRKMIEVYYVGTHEKAPY